MKHYKEIRFFSTVLSTTVISLNAIAVTPSESQSSVDKSAWLSCIEQKGNVINCDNTEKYKLITNKELIARLEKELESKKEIEILIKNVQLSHEEIDNFFSFLSSGKPTYLSPKVRFNILDEVEEMELKEQLKLIQDKIVKNEITDPEALYNDPQLKLKSIPKEQFDEIISKYRRNGYAKNETPSNYVVCGVVGTVAVSIMVSKVGTTMNNKTNTGGGGNFKPEDLQKNKELIEKIIPVLPKQDKCNDR